MRATGTFSSITIASSNVYRSEVLSRRSSIISNITASTNTIRLPLSPGHSFISFPYAAEFVHEFCFSELGVLYAVCEPEQSPDLQEHKVTVLSCTINDTVRRAHNPIEIFDRVSSHSPANTGTH